MVHGFFAFLDLWLLKNRFVYIYIFDSRTQYEKKKNETQNRGAAIYLSSLSLASHLQCSNKHISFASMYICLSFPISINFS